MTNKFNTFENRIKNGRKITEIRYNFANRKHFRFLKSKEGVKYRLSKRLKHQTKYVRNGFIKKICARPLSLMELLFRMKLYKQALSLKLLFVLIPFIILNITDGFVISVVITTVNIFCCYLMFSLTITEKREAIVDGQFDYGKYKTIKAKKETVAIVAMFLISLLLIIIGHYYLNSIIQIFTGLVSDV